MNITSIFGFSGFGRNSKVKESNFFKINNFLKNKIGVGVKLVLTIVIIYLIVTLLSIYNLLVGL